MRDKASPERTTAKIEGIPEDIQDLLEVFCTWTYTDIAQEVRLRTLARLNDVSSPNVYDQGDVCAPQAALEPRDPEQWMESEEEAQQLAEQIQREALLIEVDLCIQQIRRYRVRGTQHDVFLVDVLQEGTPEIYASPEQWQDYFEEIQDLMQRLKRGIAKK